jgi:ParB family transcriptional regulator, chromosome partitioning protein
MARVVDYREIALDQLELGQLQARQRVSEKGIPELAESIARQGLLQPILIAPADQSGRYEILIGQRRFLAHQFLTNQGRLDPAVIMCAVLDERVEEAEAKAVSLTENLLREGLSSVDTIEACTYLYKRWGSAKAVAEETGISYDKVRQYIKYPRLVEPLKQLVDEGSIKVETALRAQDIATGDDERVDAEAAVQLAKEMGGMSGAQQKKIVQTKTENPDLDTEELIEDAKSGSKITQILVTLTSNIHAGLQRYATEQDTTQDDAAGALIEDGLRGAGFV